MDLNDYWQENKRFVTAVALGLVVFLVARGVLASKLGSRIAVESGRINRFESGIARAAYTSEDLGRAERENDALRAAVTTLEEATAFVARPEFRLDPAAGPSPNQYRRALALVREDLQPRANRANVRIDESFGMPTVSPTREGEIERYLEALDAVEETLRLAIDARVDRVDKISVKLDSKLGDRDGVGRVERTRIIFTVIGDPLAVERLLVGTQRTRERRALHLGDFEIEPSRSKEDERRLDLTLILARLHDVDGEEVAP